MSGEKLEAEWSAVDARCTLACLDALIGAQERPLATLGVHSTRTVCSRAGKRTDDNHPVCVAHRAELKATLTQYVQQMGVDPSLVDAAYQVPIDTMRYLTRAMKLCASELRVAQRNNRHHNERYKNNGLSEHFIERKAPSIFLRTAAPIQPEKIFALASSKNRDPL